MEQGQNGRLWPKKLRTLSTLTGREQAFAAITGEMDKTLERSRGLGRWHITAWSMPGAQARLPNLELNTLWVAWFLSGRLHA